MEPWNKPPRCARHLVNLTATGNCFACESERSTIIEKPAHYNAGEIECIDAIKAALGDSFPHYLRGNIMKYLWRYEYKGKPAEDLKKAQWYLNKLVKEIEND